MTSVQIAREGEQIFIGIAHSGFQSWLTFIAVEHPDEPRRQREAPPID